MTNLGNVLKSRHYFADKGPSSQSYGFSSSHVCESWTIRKAEHRRIDAFELWCWRRLLSPLYWKEIQPVSPRGDQSWMFIGRTDAEVEAPILWPPDAKNWLIWKDLDAGIDWTQAIRGWQRMTFSVGSALPTQWTWVGASSGSWWWTGKTGVL